MNDTWSRKFMMSKMPYVMFSNRNISSNVIFTLEDLAKAVQSREENYRLVPINVIEKTLDELKRKISLKYNFSAVVSAS